MQVTSWNPLVVYLYEEGLGRFATELYNVEHIERRCMHLTNYSLNKHNKKFVPNTDAAQVRPPAPGAHLPRLGQGRGVLCLLTRASRRHARMTPAPSGASQLSGVKWRKTSARRKPLRCVHAHASSSEPRRARPFRARLHCWRAACWPGVLSAGAAWRVGGAAHGCVRPRQIWRAVDDLVVKTAISVEHIMSGALPNFVAAAAHGEHNSQCFQVFGFDVMLDGTGRPWLLEVNLDPALGTESPIDHKIKSHMLVDLLNVVGVPVPVATAEGTTPMPMPVSGQGAETAAGAVPAADAPPVPPAADAARDADGFTRREREALRIVNAEYERSQQGGWRRLFPSSRSKEYSGYLDPARQLHHLPFNV